MISGRDENPVVPFPALASAEEYVLVDELARRLPPLAVREDAIVDYLLGPRHLLYFCALLSPPLVTGGDQLPRRRRLELAGHPQHRSSRARSAINCSPTGIPLSSTDRK